MTKLTTQLQTQGLAAFEYTDKNYQKQHTLIFIGGLGDGLNTVEYVADIAAALQSTEWSIFNPILSSSYSGWGTGSLGRDVDEIAQCVTYVSEYKPGGKVVLMGHSTGSQDVLHYLSCENPQPRDPVPAQSVPCNNSLPAGMLRPKIDGAIMQAPVSDREAILWVAESGTERDSPRTMNQVYQNAVAEAKRKMYEDQDSGNGSPGIKRDTIVPLPVTARIGYPATTPMSSRRFLTLVSPESPQDPSENDIFSSDLGDEQLRKTFGAVCARSLLVSNGKLMVLYSGRDQSVPPWVNKDALLRRWRLVLGEPVWHSGSMIIPGASHALSDDDQAESRQILVKRVMGYLRDVERQG